MSIGDNLCGTSNAHSPGVFSSHIEPVVSLGDLLDILELRAAAFSLNQSYRGLGSRKTIVRGGTPVWVSNAIELLKIDLSDLHEGQVRMIQNARFQRVCVLARAEFARHLFQLRVIQTGKPIPQIGNWKTYPHYQLVGICGITIARASIQDFGKLAISDPATGKESVIDPIGCIELVGFVRSRIDL